MRGIKYLLLFSLLSLITLSSCSILGGKDKDSGDFYLEFKGSGNEYIADLENNSTTITKDHGRLFIKSRAPFSSYFGEGEAELFIAMQKDYNKPGEYTIGSAENGDDVSAMLSLILPQGWLYFKSDDFPELPNGTLTVTSENKNVIEGSFEFRGYNTALERSIVITEGKFRLKVSK